MLARVIFVCRLSKGAVVLLQPKNDRSTTSGKDQLAKPGEGQKRLWCFHHIISHWLLMMTLHCEGMTNSK
jgi:hypothetical protein